MPSNAKYFRVEHDKNENAGSLIDSRNENGEPCGIIEEDNIPKSESETISMHKSTDKNVLDDVVFNSLGREEKTHNSFLEIDLSDKREKEVPAVGKETNNPQSKPLNSLFDDEQGNDEKTRNAKDIFEKSAKKFSEILDSKTNKKQDEKKRATSNNVKANKTSAKSSPRKLMG
ncbi:hypothetical protein REPUB_Repub12eG0069900 [Reevesia pubescens]